MSSKYAFRPDPKAFALWERLHEKRRPSIFAFEVTARCNNACRHCYINLPAGDRKEQSRELSLAEIDALAEEAKQLGVLSCLLTGGEPLLREDFPLLYELFRRKGFLVTIFTNACLVTSEHVALFQRMPPYLIEVTMYGATAETYDRVSQRPGSYAAFRRGLALLSDAGIPVRLKAMALRSNIHEMPEIAQFCRAYTKDYYRFDPLLHLRYDGDAQRNRDILSERLSPEEIVAVEQADDERATCLHDHSEKFIMQHADDACCRHLFHCGAGLESFTLGPDGTFRLCQSLCHPDCVVNIRHGGLTHAWQQIVPRVRSMESSNADFLQKCHRCSLVNLCIWCPAHGYLESGQLDGCSEYFCRVAEARAKAITVKPAPLLSPAEP